VSGRCPTSFPAAIGEPPLFTKKTTSYSAWLIAHVNYAGIGASFNLELVKQMGIAIGDEAR
jgi:hypothetical protein